MITVEHTLQQQWESLKKETPSIRIRNAAKELGVSEVELLATECGENVVRLRPEFANILKEVEKFGKVMALTRNEFAVHERKGVYLNSHLDNPHVGMFVGEDIDLRIFLNNWDSVFAVRQETKAGERFSLQFFSKSGEATHKIFLLPQSNYQLFEELTEKFIDQNQFRTQEVTPPKPAEAELPDSDIDLASFQKGWVNLKDTHHFFGLVKKHKVGRMQALRLAPEGNYAVKVRPVAFRKCIELASQTETPIMVFVGNGNMIQIHTGKVNKIVDAMGWFNIMDPDFNLHLNQEEIAHAWIVRKPTTDGLVTALECYDSEGKQIVQLFGKRKPGIPELDAWKEITREVESMNSL
ncbi:MAG: putative hemin transport protein [Arenicella sp.]|jgi:putative hemin transport protein